MEAPNWVSSVAPTKARIRPMRKLIRATIPNASGPHCWMTRKVSDQRNCAWPRSIFSKATTLSPMKLSISAPPVQATRPDSPTRWRKDDLRVLARRVFLFRNGLGQRDQLRQAVRQGLGAELDVCFRAQIVNGEDAHHQGAVPASQLARASNSNALTPAAGQLFLHRRDVRQACPIQPIARDFDQQNTVLFPPSGQPCGNMFRITHCEVSAVAVEKLAR